MDSGELCVMMILVQLMLTLYADNWDTPELLLMTTCPCKLYKACYLNLYISGLTNFQHTQPRIIYSANLAR